ncbi:MAG: DUF2723 domain-containing protein [candidate division Zixibacteria bacterium]|nr:DUF2723 domain-containing protein [candidate division Zixibacteria bacterium]
MTEFINRINIDKTNAIIATLVWLFILIIYNLTQAISLSFWDCGEFIASCSILGVPHPPGTPLYVMIGRIFSLVPLFDDMAQRVNFLSVLSSSFTALFGYLVAVRILRNWFISKDDLYSKILIYAGSVSGSLFLAFGLTNWNNSVEAEVYGLSMMLFMAIFWLTLIYSENKGNKLADRIMLLIIYLGFVGIGIHMTTFLVIPVVVLFFILKKDVGNKIWFGLGLFFFAELYLIFALSSLPNEIPYYVPITMALVVFMFFVFSFEQIPRIYMHTILIFILSIFPVIGKGIEMIIGPIADSYWTIINYVGYLSSGVLILFGLFVIYKYYALRKTEDATVYLMSGLFIMASIIMVVLLLIFKGYQAFLVISALFALILLAVLWKHINWSILIAVGGSSLIVFGIKPFVYGMLVSAIILVVGGLLKYLPGWKISLMIIFMAVAGFSVHVYIPIRSAQQPVINENNPSKDLTTTINYLERKQYGSMSMTERMFKRRSEWVNQFGMHRRMGYWGFFNEQYGINGVKFVFIFLLGVFGIWEIIRRRPDYGLLFFILFLVSSVGLILYMNFADGTRSGITSIDYLEVRERDYFFTPAFVLFGLAIGIGLSVLLQFLRESVQSFGKGTRNIVMYSSLVLFLLPTFTIANNYFYCDRSNNYMAFDYANNILSSADKDAVLFTGGDNDTFPLWCLQETYGIRKDVKNVNLSLANTKWYIKQLQNTMGVNLGWTERDIDNLRPYRTQDGTIFRLADQVVDAVITNNIGERPIEFAVTTSSGSRKYLGKPLKNKLRLKGMVYEVDTSLTSLLVEKEISLDFYTNPNKFKARGINDSTIYKNETAYRLTSNYANGILVTADHLRRDGDIKSAEILAKRAIELVPISTNSIDYLAQLYLRQGKVDEIKTLINKHPSIDKKQFMLYLGQAYDEKGESEEAIKVFNSILSMDPSHRAAFEEMLRIFYNSNQLNNMVTLLKQWLRFNKNDKQIRDLLNEFENEIAKKNQKVDSVK